jgi:hypothetical protein
MNHPFSDLIARKPREAGGPSQVVWAVSVSRAIRAVTAENPRVQASDESWMLWLGIHQARAGMTLGHPIWHPEVPGTVLLKRGTTLAGPVIPRLRQLGVTRVWVDEPNIPVINEAYSSDLKRARGILADRITSIAETVRGRAAGEPQFGALREAIADVADEIFAQPGAALYTEDLGPSLDPFVRHAESVTFLSMLIGAKLGFYLSHERQRVAPTIARNIVPLGMGAALADIGLASLSGDQYRMLIRDGDRIDETAALSAPERERLLEMWNEHPQLGYELVHRKIESAGANAVLHHHQCWNGSGFPARRVADGAMRAPSGRDIHVFARVVAAADRFCRLRIWGESGTGLTLGEGPDASDEQSPGGQSPGGTCPIGVALPTVRVLRMLQSMPEAECLDLVAVRGLVAAVPAFAPGEIIELNDGRAAVVTGHIPCRPCDPRLQPLTRVRNDDGSHGYMLVGDELPEGSAAAGLRVAKVGGVGGLVNGGVVDVSADLFFPKHPGTYDLDVIEQAIYQRAAAADGRAA